MTVGFRRRSQMDGCDFEELAVHAPEGVRLEFINGRLGVKPATDGGHTEILRWITQHCVRQRPELWLYAAQGLRVEVQRRGYARPGGALAPVDTFAGEGEWADPTGVLTVLEITSYDEEADHRDRAEKPVAYAQAGIPVYLLIDRDSCDVTVFSEPEDGKYRTSLTVAFGHTIDLPGLGINLNTEAFKNYVR